MVDWLHQRVDGFQDRREARKYAAQMLKAGYIRHTVNKKDFSEQCYYVFGDLCASECYISCRFFILDGMVRSSITLHTVAPKRWTILCSDTHPGYLLSKA